MISAASATTSRRTVFLLLWIRFLAVSMTIGLAGAVSSEAAARYAAIVVDYGTGRTLIAEAEDTPTYPASLTKMMTAYMTFDSLRAGKLKLSTPLQVSRRAASRPPSRLGLVEGRTITVENALLAILTKSANDAAVVLAEAIAGSEDAFAKAMTKRALGLGLRRTVFRNASGLPDPEQVTTARDMATLAIRLIRDHPSRYAYFSRRSFEYGGRRHMNHNRLLARYPGVDGLKTGYIGAAGYNLVASSKRDGRRVIAVVLGGRSARLRDRQMMALIDEGFAELGIPRALPTEMRRLAARERERAGRLTVAELPQALLDLPSSTSATPQRRPATVEAIDRAAEAARRAASRRAPLPVLRDSIDARSTEIVEDVARSMLVASLERSGVDEIDGDGVDDGSSGPASVVSDGPPKLGDAVVADDLTPAAQRAAAAFTASHSREPAELASLGAGAPRIGTFASDGPGPAGEELGSHRIGGRPVPVQRAVALARIGAVLRAQGEVPAAMVAAVSTLAEPEVESVEPIEGDSDAGSATPVVADALPERDNTRSRSAAGESFPGMPLPRRKPIGTMTLADAAARQWRCRSGRSLIGELLEAPRSRPVAACRRRSRGTRWMSRLPGRDADPCIRHVWSGWTETMPRAPAACCARRVTPAS